VGKRGGEGEGPEASTECVRLVIKLLRGKGEVPVGAVAVFLD